MSILITLIIFGVLVVVHEFGHFIAAKRSGVKVERFSIGFGPALFKKKGKETEFLICVFPLGGYVKMAGDTKTDYHKYDYEFLAKAPGIKMKIVFWGPLFNYIFAFLLFWGIAVLGVSRIAPSTVIGSVLEGYPAYQAGIKAGDVVLKVNDQKVSTWVDMQKTIAQSQNEAVFFIQRSNENMTVVIPLKKTEVTDQFGRKQTSSIVGISPQLIMTKYNVFEAFFMGGKMLFELTYLSLKGFILIILQKIPFRDAIMGPLGIVDITSQVVPLGIAGILKLMAVLNVSLAIVNLFPLPLLDGGHIFIFFIEKLRRKPLSEKIDDFVTRLGFVILGVLVVFVFYVDIQRLSLKMSKKHEGVSIGEISNQTGK